MSHPVTITPADIPAGIRQLLDDLAGQVHSDEGRVVSGLAQILTEWEMHRRARAPRPAGDGLDLDAVSRVNAADFEAALKLESVEEMRLALGGISGRIEGVIREARRLRALLDARDRQIAAVRAQIRDAFDVGDLEVLRGALDAPVPLAPGSLPLAEGIAIACEESDRIEEKRRALAEREGERYALTPEARTEKLPPVNGCRHCGVLQHEHGQRWAAGRGWHTWAAPSDGERLGRMRAQRAARTHPSPSPVSPDLSGEERDGA